MIITNTMIIILMTPIIITVDIVLYHNGTEIASFFFINCLQHSNLQFCEHYI